MLFKWFKSKKKPIPKWIKIILDILKNENFKNFYLVKKKQSVL